MSILTTGRVIARESQLRANVAQNQSRRAASSAPRTTISAATAGPITGTLDGTRRADTDVTQVAAHRVLAIMSADLSAATPLALIRAQAMAHHNK